MERCPDEISFFNSFVDKGLKQRLEHVASSDFGRVSYTEAVEILEEVLGEVDFSVLGPGRVLRVQGGDPEHLPGALAVAGGDDGGVDIDKAPPEAKQPLELKAETIAVEGVSAPEYPLQKKRHSVELVTACPDRVSLSAKTAAIFV